MRVLVWHWGRRGAGPRYAALLAEHLAAPPEVEATLSLPDNAELLTTADPPAVALPVRTYAGPVGLAWRAATAPFWLPPLARRLRTGRATVAVCAMPAMLDLVMATALRRAGIPFVVVVHDAAAHPGERVPLQHRLQRRLLGRAAAVVALSDHVARRLRAGGVPAWVPILRSTLPPLFGGTTAPPGTHGGAPRLLSFGRLLPYKGLDLLRDALRLLPQPLPFSLRVVGHGPHSPVLDALRAMPGVTVENRWVPEAELPALIGWADALVLSHREASQSGTVGTALAAGRAVVATRVGGLAEQLAGAPGAILCDVEAGSLARALLRAVDLHPVGALPGQNDWPAVAAQFRQAIAPFQRRT